MRIAVTGSIATDHLLTYPGRFTEAILGEHVEQLSLSFLTDSLIVRRGGVAANIAIGLARLGHRPVLIGSAGIDFDDYRSHLDRSGVDTRGVRVSETDYTARFICTTDTEQNQLASFYSGAMREARHISLDDVRTRTGDFDLVLVGANDPDAMLVHTHDCRASGITFAADPSQQMALIGGKDIRELVNGSAYLFTNEYEHELLNSKTGWTDAEVLEHVGRWITTLGAVGVRIDRRGQDPVRVPAVPPSGTCEPTGVGDGFRAGFLAGLAAGLDLADAARLGCALATLVLEAEGPQDYEVEAPRLLARIRDAYGMTAADAIGERAIAPMTPSSVPWLASAEEERAAP